MARTAQIMAAEPTNITAINLRRVLVRLEQKILTSPDARLARSSFERTKTSAVSYLPILFLFPCG